jgi:hypothetical protein
LIFVRPRSCLDIAQVVPVVTIAVQTDVAAFCARISAAGRVTRRTVGAQDRVAQIGTAAVAGVSAAFGSAEVSVVVAEDVADRAGTGRVADAASDVAGTSAAVCIANGVNRANDRVATIRAAHCTSVAATEGAAFRIRASRRA